MSNKYYKGLVSLIFIAFLSINARSATFYDLNSGDLIDLEDEIKEFSNLYEGNQFEYYDFRSQSYKNAIIIDVFDNFDEYEVTLKSLESDRVMKVLIKNYQ